jgi:hypothetical protein
VNTVGAWCECVAGARQEKARHGLLKMEHILLGHNARGESGAAGGVYNLGPGLATGTIVVMCGLLTLLVELCDTDG